MRRAGASCPMPYALAQPGLLTAAVTAAGDADYPVSASRVHTLVTPDEKPQYQRHVLDPHDALPSAAGLALGSPASELLDELAVVTERSPSAISVPGPCQLDQPIDQRWEWQARRLPQVER
jgi:hypothetical protein